MPESPKKSLCVRASVRPSVLKIKPSPKMSQAKRTCERSLNNKANRQQPLAQRERSASQKKRSTSWQRETTKRESEKAPTAKRETAAEGQGTKPPKLERLRHNLSPSFAK